MVERLRRLCFGLASGYRREAPFLETPRELAQRLGKLEGRSCVIDSQSRFLIMDLDPEGRFWVTPDRGGATDDHFGIRSGLAGGNRPTSAGGGSVTWH